MKKKYLLDLGKCEAGGISMNILFDSMGGSHKILGNILRIICMTMFRCVYII